MLYEVKTRVERYPAVPIDQWPRWKSYIGKDADSLIVGTIFSWAESYFNHRETFMSSISLLFLNLPKPKIISKILKQPRPDKRGGSIAKEQLLQSHGLSDFKLP